MIDEKKITEAVNAYIGFPKELGEGLETSMRRDAFKAGVEWFKKALWHDANLKIWWARRTGSRPDPWQGHGQWQYAAAGRRKESPAYGFHDRKGKTVGETKTAHEDHACDDQIA